MVGTQKAGGCAPAFPASTACGARWRSGYRNAGQCSALQGGGYVPISTILNAWGASLEVA